MIEPWTSVDEIASHLGVAKDSIYRWIDRRSLPAHRIGRLWKLKVGIHHHGFKHRVKGLISDRKQVAVVFVDGLDDRNLLAGVPWAMSV